MSQRKPNKPDTPEPMAKLRQALTQRRKVELVDVGSGPPLLGPPHAASSDVCVKLVDFGFARLFSRGAEKSNSIPRAGGALGTAEFVAPEQALNFHHADIRSDLYSLGCSFYFALTGVLPFDGESTLEVLSKQLEVNPVPLRDLRPEVPGALATIIHRLMAKLPEDRFPTPADLIAELKQSHGSGVRALPSTVNLNGADL